MIGSQIISDVRSELLEPVPGFWTDAELLNWINRAEADFVGRTRCLESSATMDTEVGRREYPLPSNHLSLKAAFIKTTIDPERDVIRRLETSSLEKVAQQQQTFLSDDTDKLNDPDTCFIWDSKLNLVPTPKTAGQIVTIYYKAKPVPLLTAADSINIDDSLAPGITAYVLWKAWFKEKEIDLAKDQQALYAQYVRDGLRWVKLQAGDRLNQIDNRSPYPYSRGFGGAKFDPLA